MTSAKTSWFTFFGEIHPKESIPNIKAGYSLNRKSGSVGVKLDGYKVTIDFAAYFDNFEELFYEIREYVQAFFSVGAMHSGLPLELIINEWIERPLEPLGEDGISHPVKGRVLKKTPEMVTLSGQNFLFALGKGVMWSEDIDANPFLRRAALDFNYALQHPLGDIPIYLYRAIESAQNYFGGEAKLIQTLDIKRQVGFVKRLANDARSGIHARHAAKTSEIKQISNTDVLEAARATKYILERFHLQVMSKRGHKE